MTIPEINIKTSKPLAMRKVLKTWLPLLASWMLMSIELPIINAVVARLSNPEVNLAAYGVVYSLALVFEAPVVMILAASTNFSKDWDSYQKLKKITLILGISMSALHLVVALTPILNFILKTLMDVPPEIVNPARMAMIFMTPWTFGIAYRRFQQGAMIRFNRSHMVSETTIIRLVVVIMVMIIGITVKTIPGTIVAGFAQGLAVTSEAVYATFRIRKILPEIRSAKQADRRLTLKRFIRFYIPLAITAAISLVWLSLVNGAISRMPVPLESLAVWSVLTGLFFLFRSPGLAYNEAVVALIDEERAYPTLKKFTFWAGIVTAGLAILIVVTPISRTWFSIVANLSPEKVNVGRIGLALCIPLTFLTLMINFFQGILVKSEATRAVAEAVGVFLAVLLLILALGVAVGFVKGVYVAASAYSIAHLVQCVWLWLRSRAQRNELASGG